VRSANGSADIRSGQAARAWAEAAAKLDVGEREISSYRVLVLGGGPALGAADARVRQLSILLYLAIHFDGIVAKFLA